MTSKKIVRAHIMFLMQEILCGVFYHFGFLSNIEYLLTALLMQWNTNGTLAVNFEMGNFDIDGYTMEGFVFSLAILLAKNSAGTLGVVAVQCAICWKILTQFSELTNITLDKVIESAKFNKKVASTLQRTKAM